MSYSVRELLKQDLLRARKARQTTVIAALRNVLAELDHAEAVPIDTSVDRTDGMAKDVPRRILTEADVQSILQAEIASLHSAELEYQQHGVASEVSRLQTEQQLLSAYLTA